MSTEGLFVDEISGLGRIKLLGLNSYDTMKVTFKTRNKAFLEETNNSTQGIVLHPKEL